MVPSQKKQTVQTIKFSKRCSDVVNAISRQEPKVPKRHREHGREIFIRAITRSALIFDILPSSAPHAILAFEFRILYHRVPRLEIFVSSSHPPLWPYRPQDMHVEAEVTSTEINNIVARSTQRRALTRRVRDASNTTSDTYSASPEIADSNDGRAVDDETDKHPRPFVFDVFVEDNNELINDG